MMERFHQLAPREQVMVVIGAALVLVFVLWSLVWSPLHASTNELDEAVAEKSRLVIDLRRASGLGSSSGRVPAPSNETMMLLVDRTGRANGLAFSRSQPDGPDALIVSIQGAAFDALIEWLIELQQSHGVSVSSASLSGARTPGLVDGQIFLDRS